METAEAAGAQVVPEGGKEKAGRRRSWGGQWSYFFQAL